MEKPASGLVRLGIATALVLVTGAAVLGVNLPGAAAGADSVTVLKAQGVTCGSCAGRIERALKEKAGVASVEVDVDNGGVAVAYDAKVIRPEILAETVTALGYQSRVVQNFAADEYRAATGRDVSAQAPAQSAGCGCCNRKSN